MVNRRLEVEELNRKTAERQHESLNQGINLNDPVSDELNQAEEGGGTLVGKVTGTLVRGGVPSHRCGKRQLRSEVGIRRG